MMWTRRSKLNALWTEYRAEGQGKPFSLPQFNPNAGMVYDRVKAMCEWRLGRQAIEAEVDGKWEAMTPEPKSLDEIQVCLKRIRKSVDLWTKRGVRQGYLYFIENNAGL